MNAPSYASQLEWFSSIALTGRTRDAGIDANLKCHRKFLRIEICKCANISLHVVAEPTKREYSCTLNTRITTNMCGWCKLVWDG